MGSLKSDEGFKAEMLSRIAQTTAALTRLKSVWNDRHISLSFKIRLIQQAIGPHEDFLTIVKRRKLQWYGHAACSSSLAKTILQGTEKGGRRLGRQRKRWEDNIREWTGLEFAKSHRASENGEKMEETGCKIICGAPTTLAVKRWMR